jgi:glycosyltransferase involved in cell wall biosynthesis
MKPSVFMTDSVIQESGTGGGIVCYQILQALKESTDVLKCVDKKSMPAYGAPFLIDYFTNAIVDDAPLLVEEFCEGVAVSYGAPFGQSMQTMSRLGYLTVADVAPHNIDVSREEHKRLGYGWNAPHLDNEVLWKIYTKHLTDADVVVVHSKMGGEYLKEKCGIADYKVIPHGCDIPEKYVPLPEQFAVGHIGVNGADKGQVYLVQAAAKAHAGLWIAGAGTEVWQGGLGYVADPSCIYDNCSVYVQPSVTEGFGVPVLEAMARGRPVIVAEGAGAAELVEGGHNGYVVPIRDVESIVGHIEHFKKYPQEVERMGMNALETAKENTWEIIRSKYKELWK